MIKELQMLIYILMMMNVLSQTYLPRDSSMISLTKESIQPSSPSKCICDITNDHCDLFCCCDPLCSSLKSNYQALGVCSDTNRQSPQRIPSCQSLSKKLNDLTGGVTLFMNLIDSLLCLQYSQSSQSTYVTAKPPLSLSDTRQQMPSLSLDRQTQDSTVFKLDRAVLKEGNCYPQQVQLYQTMDSQTCYRVMTSVEYVNMCKQGTVLDPKYYYESTVAKQVMTVGVTLNSTWLIDNDNRVTKVEVDSSTSITYTSNSSYSTCTYHVSILQYTVKLDTIDPINKPPQSVLLDIYIKKQTSFLPNQQVRLPQVTGLSFASDHNPKGLTNNGGIGYIQQSQVNIGVLYTVNDKKSIVVRKPSRLSIADPETGLCYVNQDQKGFRVDRAGQTLLFGVDMVMTCSAYYNQAELKTACASQMYKNSILVNIQQQLGYMGVFQKADQNYISDWLEIKNTIINDLNGLQGVYTDNKCKFKYPQLQIYYSQIGSEQGYQYKINYAQIVLEDQYFSYHGLDLNVQQQFNYQMTVVFLKLDQQLEYYVAQLPSSNLYCPNDVLFPFYIANAYGNAFVFIHLLALLAISLILY